MTDMSMLIMLLVTGAFVWWLIESLARKVSMLGLFALLLAALGLLYAVGDGGGGGESVSCPGYEIAIGFFGECYGMDADANRAWLEQKVGQP